MRCAQHPLAPARLREAARPGSAPRPIRALRRGPSAAAAPAKRCASIDLPLPGGPTISTLWPPAAAISSARFAFDWPLTSRRSGSAPGSASVCGTGDGQRLALRRRLGQQRAHDVEQMAAPVDHQARRRAPPPRRWHRAARARAVGRPVCRCSASAIASAPRTGRRSPASDSSPANSKRSSADARRSGRSRRGCRARSAGRSGPTPSAGRPVPGSR